jgi:hypothetical protein
LVLKLQDVASSSSADLNTLLSILTRLACLESCRKPRVHYHCKPTYGLYDRVGRVAVEERRLRG